MFNNRHAGNAPNGIVKKPTIRRETILVPVSKPPSNHTAGPRKPTSSPAARPANRFKLSERAGAPKSKAVSTPKKGQVPLQRVKDVSRGLKRKSTTPDRVVFSDDDDDNSDTLQSESEASKKRQRLSDGWEPHRSVVSHAAFEEQEPLEITHGADVTSGTEASKYTNAWDQEDFETIELQYPSNTSRERFELKWPKNTKEDYRPMTDLIETVKEIIKHYFPAELAAKHLDDDTGFERRFNRIWNRESIPDFKATVEDFNSLITPLVQDGTIERELASKHRLSLELVQRVLDQIYSRTVSPKVESLRAYENGTDYVYGELLSRFCSAIFHQVKLTPGQVFVDLGSGVGNVVLQAALEIGCESWGIEYMKNPCDLAELQAKEFPGRARLWGLSVGNVHLLRGDFTKSEQIAEVLRRADVVLVNNQAFTPALNDKLLHMFLDLKDGCKVVSLKPFVSGGHRMSNRNSEAVENLFSQETYEYFSRSVSWTDHEGTYYIATMDRPGFEKRRKQEKKHGARAR